MNNFCKLAAILKISALDSTVLSVVSRHIHNKHEKNFQELLTYLSSNALKTINNILDRPNSSECDENIIALADHFIKWADNR